MLASSLRNVVPGITCGTSKSIQRSLSRTILDDSIQVRPVFPLALLPSISILTMPCLICIYHLGSSIGFFGDVVWWPPEDVADVFLVTFLPYTFVADL